MRRLGAGSSIMHAADRDRERPQLQSCRCRAFASIGCRGGRLPPIAGRRLNFAGRRPINRIPAGEWRSFGDRAGRYSGKPTIRVRLFTSEQAVYA